MSKITAGTADGEVEMYDTDLDDTDYCFILGSDGELKSVVLPEVVPFKAPKNIAKILKMFGINDISDIDQDATLH
jgi:hypothetical protein